MPEAAVNEDDLASGAEDNVRSAWKASLMQTKPVAEIVRDPTHCQFRGRVSALDAPHVFAALMSSDAVDDASILTNRLRSHDGRPDQ